ncbi:hypothetical protein CY34DRAFT_107206 [Suillus luteus UH-Slu-Lm8-n1]|uniref:Uncharacterized protein n=1 Tax=Suillus luteus UH-Slu-Lm8-n1 TaxID=930992 RepID=A0A0D0AUQ7_9AGAM|nr:hypothetical protein CY34DRAFT_107206 [Suillus luteus UH-Slu-Lm8-n1]
MARSSQQQGAKLLERGIGIWPTQLPRYAEIVTLTDNHEDTLVRMKEIDDPCPAMYGSWQELVHPLGGTYYFHNTKNVLTPMNLRRYMDLHSLEDFIDVSRAAVNEDGWTLVVLPTIFMGEERFQYYYVVPDKQVITWLEDLNGLELEAQYWKHFEFFPYQFRMECPQVRCIRKEVVCYIGESPKQKTEATTLSQSSAALMFWNLDQMNQVGIHLATIETEDLANNEMIDETGVVFCCRILYILRHHQFINRHNQPEAHLVRNHELREKHRSCKALVFMGNAAAMMLCMPITIGRIRRTSVDGILNGVEVNSLVDDFSSRAKNQITLSYYLGKKRNMFIIITGIPTSFCVLRTTGSMMGSILGFLSGVAIDFKPSAPLMIASIITLGIVLASLLVLVLASCGPGPARVRPQ